MRTTLLPLALVVCSSIPGVGQNTVSILPLGNSITHGDQTHFSYRYNLWSSLTSAGLRFDFVGTMSSNYGGNPAFPNSGFDKHHEGHRGYRADQIYSGLSNWLHSYTPDMVLLHIGTNDVFMGQSTASTVNEIKSIIDRLRADNAKVTIFLAKIIGTTASVNSKIVELNNQIDGIAATKNTSASRVIVVDQYSGFNPQTDTYDGKHPNTAGENKMAAKWYAAIRSYCSAHDLQAPTAPKNLSASNVSPTAFRVSWEASKDFIGVDRYEVFRNGASRGTTTNTTFNFDDGIEPGTTYSITVRARDAAGNWSSLSSPFNVTTPSQGGNTQNGLKGQYFNTITLSGPVVLNRTDARVDFDWGTDSPGTPVNNNDFSVRWTGYVLAPATAGYQFSTTSDDGIRLWINNQLVIDHWTDHSPKTDYANQIQLTAGKYYPVKIEYYENGGGAVARFMWSYPGHSQQAVPSSSLFLSAPGGGDDGGNGSGITAAYYNGTDLTGPPVINRTDNTVDFDFAYGSPGPGVSNNQFSARWQGEVAAPVSGNYTFTTLSDDGVRLWIDDELVIDNWTGHKATYDDSNPVALIGGRRYAIRLEYFEGGGSSIIKLFWVYPGKTRHIVPESALYPTATMSTAMTTVLDVYPNPSSGHSVNVTVQSPRAGKALLQLMSSDGIVLWESTAHADDGNINIELPVSTLPTGLYLIAVNDGDHTLIKRLRITR